MIVIDKDFVRLFSSEEQLIMIRLLLNADESGNVSFCERGLSRETGISYQKVRTIHQKLLRDKIIINAEGDIVTICKYADYNTLTKIKTQKTKEKTKPKKPLQERQHDFGLSLTPYIDTNGGKYPKEMIRAFYDYWSEPNQAQTKMKCEMQDTWSTAGRLATWARKDKNFKQNNYGRETITDKIQRSAAEDYKFSRQLKAQREANLGNGDSEKVW